MNDKKELDIESRKARSVHIGEWLAEDFCGRGNLQIGESWHAIEMAALAAWPEAIMENEQLLCDEFVLAFKQRAAELLAN